MKPLSGRLPRVGIRDVAEATGLSITSVSHALSGRRKVSADVERRVVAAATRLGYSGSSVARTLRTGQSNVIGFISDGLLTQPHGGQMLSGAQEAAAELGRILMIIDVADVGLPAAEPHIAALLNQEVDGFIIATNHHRNIAVPLSLQASEVVLLNCQDPANPRAAVIPDEAQIGRDAAHLLLRRGHRHIAHLTIDQPGYAVDERTAGFHHTLKVHEVTAATIAVPGPADTQAGRDALTRVLIDLPKTTAVFCFNDQMAMGVLQRAGALRRNVPDTLSVVGVDDLSLIASELQPPLTTIALPHFEMGRAAVQLLVKGGQARAVTTMAGTSRVRQSA